MTDTPAVAALRVQLADPTVPIDRDTVTAVLAERDRLALDLAVDRGLGKPFAPGKEEM